MGQVDVMFDVDPLPAKALCGGCEVRRECLAAALVRKEPDGVWGGFTSDERVALMKANELEIPILLHKVAQPKSSGQSAS